MEDLYWLPYVIKSHASNCFRKTQVARVKTLPNRLGRTSWPSNHLFQRGRWYPSPLRWWADSEVRWFSLLKFNLLNMLLRLFELGRMFLWCKVNIVAPIYHLLLSAVSSWPACTFMTSSPPQVLMLGDQTINSDVSSDALATVQTSASPGAQQKSVEGAVWPTIS